MNARSSMNSIDSTRRWTSPKALVAVAAALMVLVTGCQGSSSAGGPDAGGAPASSSAPAPAEPALSLSGKTTAISYSDPVKISVADGTLVSVQVTATKDDAGQALDGDVSADGSSWVSQTAPRPSASYQATAVIKDKAGNPVNQDLSFTVATVPDNHRVSFTVTPDNGQKVGIGQPVVVRFLTAVTRRKEMERVMSVSATDPAGHAVAGSWHWLNGQEVDWRPKDFWTPGTTVKLDMKIAGVEAASGRYGRKDYSETFTIGASHITRVDASAHTFRVYRDGKLVDTWATGTGRKGLETYSGTYVVLNKSAQIQMDSCSARITCDKKDPDYYDEKEKWATRLTSSGTFVHAASWDGQLGQANVSHGCIHLSDANAKTFYDNAVDGDIVIVSNSGRGPQERITTQDPGLYDWNLSWAKWKAGSAL